MKMHYDHQYCCHTFPGVRNGICNAVCIHIYSSGVTCSKTKEMGSLSPGYNFELKERIKEKGKMCYRTAVPIA
jgi:hypothetical protein